MEIRRVLDARAVLAEAALWSPVESVLYWVDQMRPEIHRFDPLTGLDSQIQLDLPSQLGALVPRASGGFVLAASDGISIIEPDFRSRKPFVNPIAMLPRASFNDAKCDR
jgi:xylono-1,5-lactonase